MAADGHYLSPQDRDRIAESVARVLGTRYGSGVGTSSAQPMDWPQGAPECYVARPTESGTIPAGAGDTPGTTLCDIFKLVLVDEVYKVEPVLYPDGAQKQLDVYNVYGDAVPYGYHIIWREKFGRWLAQPGPPPHDFYPTITDQETGYDKDLHIGDGWFFLPTNRPDGLGVPDSEYEIPARRYEKFKPQVGGYDVGTVDAVLDLPANKTIEIWATWDKSVITTPIGSKDHGSGAGADLLMEAVTSDLVSGHQHTTTAQGVVLLDWVTYVFDPSIHTVVITAHDASLAAGVSGGGGGALDGRPSFDTQGNFALQMGEIVLDAAGLVTSMDWMVKYNPMPHWQPHLVARSDAQNPQASTPEIIP